MTEITTRSITIAGVRITARGLAAELTRRGDRYTDVSPAWVASYVADVRARRR